MQKFLTRLAILGFAGVAIAGCGSSGSNATGATSAGGSTTGAGPGGNFDFSKIQKYTECLSKHGLDIQGGGNGPPVNGGGPPNGGSLPEGFTPPSGGSLPEGFTPPSGGSLPEGFTPPSGGNGATGGGLPGVDQSDPTTKKAMKACKSLQPKFPGGGQFANPGGGSNQATTTTGQSN